MTKYIATSSAGIACFLLLLLAAGAANAEVIRCTDNKGFITFTNVPCTPDMLGVQAPSAKTEQPAGKIFVGQRKMAASENALPLAALGAITGSRKVSLDERTVIGAKAYTDSSDIHSALAHEQAAVERALRRNIWAFWRL